MLALLLVVSTVAAVPMVMAQQTETETNQTSENDTAAPGAQLAAVVAVGDAELDGEVDSRAYDIRVDRANSSAAKAAVVADQLNRTSERLGELEQRRQQLEQARDNGSMSEGEYRSRVAALHAESKNAQRLVNQTNETASELPAETLEENGVNVDAIRALSDRAANLTGPETAEIARSIAGDKAGKNIGAGEAADRGAGDRTEAGDGNRTSGGDRGDTDGSTAGDTDRSGTQDGTESANETTSPGSQP
ncbi:hypothetical protein EGH22_10365 [Halomicroarcula sp. F28]|uniref:DUF7096 domain-containing protein n=1 Tax=Haloarcula salinisoli TaxID=2487746 RepID=A0A8J7YMQ9_9EURY|nr:hypothetical protein [Halomicroarcula salinisoli]MBX0304043.1 hypothetical protein [Halomicroarcula salinisoli]